MKSSFESWWAECGQKFMSNIQDSEDAGEGVLAEEAPQDLEFDDLESCDLDIEEVDLANPVDELSRSDADKISILEDRSKIQADIERVQEEVTKQVVCDEELEVADASGPAEAATTFHSIVEHFSTLACFQPEQPEFRGKTGCLARMTEMTGLLDKLLIELRIAEGLLSKAAVQGVQKNENEWNTMVHELHLAKQYNKYRGSRNSRFSSWMVAQESFISAALDMAPAKSENGPGVVAISTFRPINAKIHQFVIFQMVENAFVSYRVGLVLSIYRGSLAKTKGSSRRITMAKPLALPAPASLVSKVRVLELEPLDQNGDAMVASSLSKQQILQVCDVCGEIFPESEGAKNQVLYFSFGAAPMNLLRSLQEGKLKFGKEPPKPAKNNIEEQAPEEYLSFSIKSFPKSAAGEENIKFPVCFKRKRFICFHLFSFSLGSLWPKQQMIVASRCFLPGNSFCKFHSSTWRRRK